MTQSDHRSAWEDRRRRALAVIQRSGLPARDRERERQSSLPEFINFRLFGKTILVVNLKFGLFVGPSTQPVRERERERERKRECFAHSCQMQSNPRVV